MRWHPDHPLHVNPTHPFGAIIEHKATNPVNFSRKGRLPYLFHCLQVLTYERLLRARVGQIGVIPTYLYYRSWANWAELKVRDDDCYIVWEDQRHLEAAAEDRRYRDYLLHKYDPQPMELE